MIRSIFDKEKLSFEKALLRSVKSTHIFHFPSFLEGDNNIGEPIRIVRFPDNVGFDELGHFIFYDFQAFRGKLLLFWRTGEWSRLVNSL